VFVRSNLFVAVAVGLLLCLASVPAVAQQTQAQAQASGTASLRGHVADPTGALIPKANITITTPEGMTVTELKSDAQGTYSISGLAAGSYVVKATVEGFSPFASSPIALATGQAKSVNITMAMEIAQQSVTVSEETSQVNTEASGNVSSVVIKGSDLDALSEDPDDLANELSALAGPSVGPNGGTMYIDGFSDGTLPSKSAIKEIRINSNPFSAEYDRPGFGRIEIITKPGADKMRARLFSQGNDNVFNTGNPFAKDLPPYHSISLGGSLSGALTKTSSFSLSGDFRDNADANVYKAQTGIDTNGDPVYDSGALASPSRSYGINPRIDFQLGARNTLTFQYRVNRRTSNNSLGGMGMGMGGGSTTLPSQATNSSSANQSIQISDAFTINDHAVNETRIQYSRSTSSSSAVSSTPSVQVMGSFSKGGSGQQASSSTNTSIEFQNLTTLSIRAHAVKLGARIRYYDQSTSSSSGFNGSFSFNTVQGYVNLASQLAGITDAAARHQKLLDIAATCTQDQCDLPNNFSFSFPTGATTFTGTVPSFSANMIDTAFFVQDDWKINRFLTFSAGLRWENQTQVSDNEDWGPRVAIAYALDGHKKGQTTKTVMRLGYGFFYDRFDLRNVMNVIRQNGTSSAIKTISINNPTCFDEESLANIAANPNDLSTASYCGTGSSGSQNTNAIVQIAPNYHAPTTEQFSASLERQISKSISLALSYLHSFGVHQMVTINANPIDPATLTYVNGQATGTRINEALYGSTIVNQYLSEGIFKQDQLVANVSAKLSSKFSLTGYYTINSAKSNASGSASNSLNIDQDYGRAGFSQRQSLMMMGNYQGPFAIRFNPILNIQAGRPYNITLNNDLTGDNFRNSRPAKVDAGNCAAGNTGRYFSTTFGCLDVQPDPGYTPIPINLGTGPSSVVMNLRLSRSFAIGPKIKTTATEGQQGGEGGGPGGGGGGMPGGGGGMPGGGGGGMRGGGGGFGGMSGGGNATSGSTTAARKYSLSFTVEANNVFNVVNYGNPGGVITPTYDNQTLTWSPGDQFGKSTSLAGGMFGGGNSAVRRISFQAALSF
jgi:hypothetical protein